MLAAAKTLSTITGCRQGTLVIVFQPNEERGKDALAMIADSIYDPARHACPIPDIVLGQHVMPFQLVRSVPVEVL
jgi:metal-dependent amidase/aminoacylase/carboxypeptidase family protein